jgi:hypothetical protein
VTRRRTTVLVRVTVVNTIDDAHRLSPAPPPRPAGLTAESWQKLDHVHHDVRVSVRVRILRISGRRRRRRGHDGRGDSEGALPLGRSDRAGSESLRVRLCGRRALASVAGHPSRPLPLFLSSSVAAFRRRHGDGGTRRRIPASHGRPMIGHGSDVTRGSRSRGPRSRGPRSRGSESSRGSRSRGSRSRGSESSRSIPVGADRREPGRSFII